MSAIFVAMLNAFAAAGIGSAICKNTQLSIFECLGVYTGLYILLCYLTGVGIT